mmetsp:Transcript_4965/g.12442  ORF Transcript_4965/g.12442 Transcript_4965/m.12442 type:complete len:257 (+) Transcript_4965:746-1516(+)
MRKLSSSRMKYRVWRNREEEWRCFARSWERATRSPPGCRKPSLAFPVLYSASPSLSSSEPPSEPEFSLSSPLFSPPPAVFICCCAVAAGRPPLPAPLRPSGPSPPPSGLNRTGPPRCGRSVPSTYPPWPPCSFICRCNALRSSFIPVRAASSAARFFKWFLCPGCWRGSTTTCRTIELYFSMSSPNFVPYWSNAVDADMSAPCFRYRSRTRPDRVSSPPMVPRPPAFVSLWWPSFASTVAICRLLLSWRWWLSCLE